MTQIITNSNGGGGSGGSGDMLKSVYDPQNIEADAFDYDNFTNTPDLSGYQTTANLVTDLTSPDDTHYPSALAVSNAISSAGGGDVTGPASSTDGDIVLFDGATGKLIKDGSKSLSDLQDKLTAGDNIKIASNVISATPHVYVIKESDITKTTTATKGVAPYNTEYYYSNFQIADNIGVVREEGALYLFMWNSFTASSSYRNVRFRIGTSGDWIPFMNAGGVIVAGSTYIKKAYVRPYIYSTRYENGGALHLLQDDNTTYSTMSVAEGQTATATTARSVRSDYLKQIIKYHAVDDTAYANTWDGVTDLAPSQNAVYDKISSIDDLIPSAATSSNQLADKKYVDDAVADLMGLGKFLSLWDASTGQPISFPLDTPYTYTTGDYYLVETVSTTNYKPDGSSYSGTASSTVETEELAVGDIYIYDGTNWLLQLNHGKSVSFSEIAGNATDNTSLSNALAGKQNTLTTQTAYTTKGTSTKVPTITTNTLGQVTAITETDIAFPVTSVNGSTGAVTVSEFSPSNAGNTDQVLTKTAGGYEWANASGGSIEEMTQATYNDLPSTKLTDGVWRLIYE